MKKILISILGILGIGFSFCSAQFISTVGSATYIMNGTYDFSYPAGTDCFYTSNKNDNVSFYDSSDNLIGTLAYYSIYCNVSYYVRTDGTNSSYSFRYFSSDSFGNSSFCPDQLIDVQYNSGNTTTITCDGINYISIDGLSTLTNSNVNYEYTPYMNIDYKDEDNQSLIESYDKSILYLSGSLFKKTYTDNNDWILSSQGLQTDNFFSGYLPTFDITGGIEEVSTSGNIFNNFAENSVKFTLSNVPSYIQYVIIIMLLLFVLGFIRKFKRR